MINHKTKLENLMEGFEQDTLNNRAKALGLGILTGIVGTATLGGLYLIVKGTVIMLKTKY